MNFIKSFNFKYVDILIYAFVILYIILHGIYIKDYYIAILSAICGISYSFWAGKGYPVCYILGLLGSSFYIILSFKNALWGNLLLYMFYYIPMQILGFFKWNNNLKTGKLDVKKEELSKKGFFALTFIAFVLSLILSLVFYKFHDSHPLLDGFTTVFSILGMYFTVQRLIEQWICWMIVNFLSLIMWLYIAFTGVKVFSTVLMWAIYLVLAIWFYIVWRKEINLVADE